MLIKAKAILKKKDIIYIEVPEVLTAKKGKNREEFHIDYLYFFQKNLYFFSKKIYLDLKLLKSIREPSRKFTIYAFITK